MFNRILQNRAFKVDGDCIRTLIFTKSRAYMDLEGLLFLEIIGVNLNSWADYLINKMGVEQQEEDFIITELSVKSLLTHNNPMVRRIVKGILDACI